MPNPSSSPDRVEIPPDSFLRTTGQLWKLVVGALVLPWPALAVGWWSLRRIGADQSAADVAISMGALTAIAALITGLVASVRCPHCHARLLRHLMASPGGLNALAAFLKQRTCPVCGHDPRGAATR